MSPSGFSAFKEALSEPAAAVPEMVRVIRRDGPWEAERREIRHRDMKAAIQEGIDSEDAAAVEDVVARNRTRREGRTSSKK